MAIKAGQILHAMNRSVVDRIQTAGAGNLNIPTEKIRELGNFQTVATVRDLPDLSFNLDCLDVDTEIEALLTGVSADNVASQPLGNGLAVAAAQYDLLTNYPVDITSPWKSRQGAYDVIRSVAVPHLTLEQASYRYGLQENAGETFTLRGDSIFYIPGSVETLEAVGTGSATNFPFEVTRGASSWLVDALLYVEAGTNLYALNVSVDGQRQVLGADADFIADNQSITFNTAPANGAKIRITFGYDPATSDPAGLDDTWPQSVHQGLSIKPAAIRGKDLDLRIAIVANNVAPTVADFVRWTDVQSFNVDWRVTIEDDFEFGNPRAVNRDYTDSPEVTGAVEVRHRDVEAMFVKLQEITGVSANQVIGAQSSRTVHLLLQLRNPEGHGTTSQPDGTILKSLYIPDARFVLPGYEGRVQQKLNQTINFDSDAGAFKVFKGAPINSQFVAADTVV
jgi:hypothetical protein